MRRKHNPLVALLALLLLALIVTSPGVGIIATLLVIFVGCLFCRIDHHAQILKDSEEEK